MNVNDESAVPGARERMVAILVGLFVLTGAAAWSFEPVFGAARTVELVAGAAVPAVALAAFRRVPIVAGLVLWPVAVSIAVLRAVPSVGALRFGVVDSWHWLLTQTPPAGPDPRLMVGVHLAVWVAGLFGTALALRAGMALAAAVPALAVLVAGAVLSAGRAEIWPVAGVVLGAGLLAGVPRAGRLLPGHSAGPGLAAVALVCAVTAAATGVLPLPARAAFDPRGHVVPRSRPQPVVDPLDEVSAWLAQPDVPLFSVSAGSAADWRLTVLDGFDGVSWSQPDHYVATGGPIGAATAGSTLAQTVTVQQLGGYWLPAAERPVAVDGIAAAADPVTGTLLAAAPLTSGLTYRVRSAPPAVSAAALQNAAPDDSTATAQDREPPVGLPQALTDLAEQATAGAGTPAQQAVRLADYLRATESFNATAPPGHSLGHLVHVLTQTHRGTSEQIAAAYVVLARVLGLPARLAVGFTSGTPGPGGTWQVRGRDVLVWPEVAFQGIGWVPFYPTAEKGAAPDDPAQMPQGEASARGAVDHQVVAAPPVPAAAPVAAARRTSQTSASSWPGMLGLAGGLAVVVYLLAVVAAPMRRRSKRRYAATPRLRVIGAWEQTVEDLREACIATEPGATAPQLAVLGSARLGNSVTQQFAALARAADRAAFAPDGIETDEDAVREAWYCRDEVSATARQSMPARRRLFGWLHPRMVRGTR